MFFKWLYLFQLDANFIWNSYLNPLHCFLFLIFFCKLLCESLNFSNKETLMQVTLYCIFFSSSYLCLQLNHPTTPSMTLIKFINPSVSMKGRPKHDSKRNWLTKAQFMQKTIQSIWTVGRSTERAKTTSDWTYRSTAYEHDLTEKETEVLETTSHFGPLNVRVLEVTILKQGTHAFLALATDFMCS